jgi:hypothetical protein
LVFAPGRVGQAELGIDRGFGFGAGGRMKVGAESDGPLSRWVKRISSCAKPANSLISGSPRKLERTVVQDPSTPVVTLCALPEGSQDSCAVPPVRSASCQSVLSWNAFRFSFQLT